MTEADDYAEPDADAWAGWVRAAATESAFCMALGSLSLVGWHMVGRVLLEMDSTTRFSMVVALFLAAVVNLMVGTEAVKCAFRFVGEYRRRSRVAAGVTDPGGDESPSGRGA